MVKQIKESPRNSYRQTFTPFLFFLTWVELPTKINKLTLSCAIIADGETGMPGVIQAEKPGLPHRFMAVGFNN